MPNVTLICCLGDTEKGLMMVSAETGNDLKWRLLSQLKSFFMAS